jgi:hypothetical protein
MKRLAAVALLVVGVALPVCAQRSSSHGGFSGHSSQGFHSGSRASAPSRFAGSSRSAGSRSFSAARGPRRGGIGNSGARPPYTGDRRFRRGYRSPYGVGVPYGGTGLIGPYGLGYSDTIDSGDSTGESSDNAASGYDAPPPEQDQPAPLPPYQPPANLSHSSPSPASMDAVTLIFKDGRPPEHIHNYLLTPTTLFVGDQQRRTIPVDQLDLTATAQVNQDAGVDFRLPVVPK